MRIHLISHMLNNGDMKTTEEIHRENLQALAEEFGGVALVAEKIGCSSSQYSQWMNGSKNSGTGKPRGMRSSSSRRIEEACGKPAGWMDRPHSEDHPPDQRDGIDADDVPTAAGLAPEPSLAAALKLTCETATELRMLTVYRLTSDDGRIAVDEVIDALRCLLDDQGLWHQDQQG